MKPPFTYFGGKTSIAPQIAALLPPHEHYVEPFAGSLAVLLAKKPSTHETVNDLDGDIVCFWRMLRDRPGDLERLCALTPHSRAEHQAAYEATEPDSDLERARRTWVKLTQGRGGSMRRTGWRYYAKPSEQSSPFTDYLAAYVSRIAPAAARLARVSLECKPANEVIRQYGTYGGVLIYADPPYPASVRNPRVSRAGHGREYGVEMLGEDQHLELLKTLLDCKAAVVLSGYALPLYDELLVGWHRREIAAHAGNGGAARARTEVLWSNRPFPQGSLFDAEVTA